MNFAIFAGRLGRDADLRSVASGQQVLNFSVAVDVGFGDNKQTLWVGCALWGDRAVKLEPYLTKGKSVTVGGDVGYRQYEKRDGSVGFEITLNVQRVTLQGGGDQQSARTDSPSGTEARSAGSGAPTSTSSSTSSAGADFDDDIPF